MKGNGKTGKRAIQEFWYHKRHDGCATIQKTSKHCFRLNGKRSPGTESNMINSHLNTIRKNKTELLDCNTQSLYINLGNQSMGFMWSPIESTTELLSSPEKAQKQRLMKGWICRIRKGFFQSSHLALLHRFYSQRQQRLVQASHDSESAWTHHHPETEAATITFIMYFFFFFLNMLRV